MPLRAQDYRPDVEDHAADHDHRATSARLMALEALQRARYYKRMGNYREFWTCLKLLQLHRFLSHMHRRIAARERNGRF